MSSNQTPQYSQNSNIPNQNQSQNNSVGNANFSSSSKEFESPYFFNYSDYNSQNNQNSYHTLNNTSTNSTFPVNNTMNIVPPQSPQIFNPNPTIEAKTQMTNKYQPSDFQIPSNQNQQIHPQNSYNIQQFYHQNQNYNQNPNPNFNVIQNQQQLVQPYASNNLCLNECNYRDEVFKYLIDSKLHYKYSKSSTFPYKKQREDIRFYHSLFEGALFFACFYKFFTFNPQTEKKKLIILITAYFGSNIILSFRKNYQMNILTNKALIENFRGQTKEQITHHIQMAVENTPSTYKIK